MNTLLKRPSAWLPIALSLAMLLFIITYIATVGVPAPDPNRDEGTPAHLFQLWLVLEALLIPLFALTWLPRSPRQAIAVLALQMIAVLPSLLIVFSIEHS